MSRIIFVVLMLSALAGCDRFPDLTIQVTANLAPDEGSCVIDADQDTVLFRGLYDLNIVRDYIVTPRIESYLIDNSLETQAPQTNIQITSFDVTLKLPDGSVPTLAGGLPNPYQVTSSAVIPPSPEAGGVSNGAAAAIAIPASYHSALVSLLNQSGFTSIVLDLRANGTTSGGFSQQSPPFSWPVEFCNGCLGAVCEPPLEVGQAPEGSCFPGQDQWVYCAEIADTTGT